MLAIITTLLVIAGLRACYPVAMPLAVAIVIIAALWPVKTTLDRVVPSKLSYAGTTVMLLLTFAAFFAAVYFSAAQIVSAFASDKRELSTLVQSISDWATRMGLPDLGGQAMSSRLAGFSQTVLSNAYTVLVYLGFIAVLVLLGLPEVPVLRRNLAHCMNRRERRLTGEIIDRSAHKVRSYLWASTLASVITGVASALWALAIGLDLALVWGMLNFLLNYIPVIGNVVGVIPPTLYAMIQYSGWRMPAIIFGGFALLQFIISNFVYPKLQGHSLSLSPVGIVVALAFWSWIWGIAGALIAVPLTASLVIVAQHFESAAWFVALLSRSGDSG